MNFDFIVTNPPYSTPNKSSRTIWEYFVILSLNLLEKDGCMAMIHPPRWRKPENKLGKMLKEFNISYLEIHNAKDGMKIFNVGTRYDIYILSKTPATGKTKVVDEEGNISYLNLKEWEFIPNFNFDLIKKLMGEKKDRMIWNYAYGTDYTYRKPWLSEVKTNNHIYPLIHATNKGGVRYWWSSTKDRGHFGIPKVIFGDSGINNLVVDDKGEYGMTQHAMAISISSYEQGMEIKKALESDKFRLFLKSVLWGNFRIEWKMFNYFRKDFWREFI